ncbi:MAG: tetratricopeptide repeat protein [Alphaproteobacteria bacterium]|nr:tetratricopeptide repeat protein [Alphaproteobacteria bacterium]
MRTTLLLATGCLLLGSMMAPVQANTLVDCDGSPTERGIQGCTRLIGSGSLETRLLAAAHNNRGFSLLQLGRYEQAIEDLNKAIELSPKFHTAFLNRGAALARAGKIDQAISDFVSVVALRPTDPIAHINLGKAHFINGQFDDAIKDYDEAIRLDPKVADSFNGRADAYFKKGQLEQALTDYDEAIRLRPNFAHAMTNRKLAVAAQKARVAKKEIEQQRKQKVKRQIPQEAAPPGGTQTVSAALRQGEMAFNKGLYESAASSFSTAIRLGPTVAAAYLGRANAYARKGDYYQAINDYTQAIRLRPNYPVAFINRGIAYYKLVKFDRAILDFDRAILLDPGYTLARESREFAMKRKDEQDRMPATPANNSSSTLRQGTSQLNGNQASRVTNN